jgi:hypothetical protein
MTKIKAVRDWILGQFGATSLVTLIVVSVSLIPDWISRFQFWRDIAVTVFHKPWFPLVARLVIILSGVAVIVADNRAHRRTGKHNIVIAGVKRVPLTYDDLKGIFIPRGSHLSREAITVEILNPAKPRKIGRSSGRVRAQLTFRFPPEARLVSPVAWVGEYFSSVEIGTGESRELIIALGEEHDTDWRVVTNRRGNSGEAVSISFEEHIATSDDGLVTVDLISCESGNVVAEFELGWKWPTGYGPQITYSRRLV